MSTSNLYSEEETTESLKNRIENLIGMEKRLQERIESITHEEDLLHALMDNIPDSIYFKDKYSKFILVNKAWATRRNVSEPKDVIGKSDFDYFSREFAEHTNEAEKIIMQTCKPQEAQLEKILADGEIRWYTSSKVPVKNNNGIVIGTCGITRDITELKRIEEELEKANIQLEIRVQERTAALKKANTLLESQIKQLHFLHRTTFSLAQSMYQVNVFSAILEAFKPCFPEFAGCICTVSEDNPPSIKSHTPGFEHEELPLYIKKMVQLFTPMQLQEPVLIPDWRKDPSLNNFSWPVNENQSCCVIIPLHADDKIVSFVIVFTTSNYAEYYGQEKSVLMTLSATSAVCQKNAMYYEELQKNARLEGELTAARNIQKKLIPQSRLSLPHIEIYGFYLPAYEVGGDYLDYFINEEGNIIIAIGDVCGKGTPASMHMTMLRTTLRIKARHESSASHLICEVNNSIRNDLSTLSFISLLCIIVNADCTELKYARAGHPPLLKFNTSGSNASVINCNGIALGLLSDSASFDSYIEEVTLPIKKGDQFFIYTDGLVEAINSTNQNYGVKRLSKVLQDYCAADPEIVINSVIKDVNAFENGIPHRDDLTMCSFSIS